MSIKERLEKIKPFYYILLVLVISSIFFAVGRLSALEERHAPLKITYSTNEAGSVLGAFSGNQSIQTTEVHPLVPETLNNGGQVISSKTGKKYYFPWCGTVKRIKLENQVHFASAKEAKMAGFTPGANCKGLK